MKKEEARPTPASVSGTSSNTKSISDITTANDLREAISETNNSEHAVHTSDDAADAVDDAPESVAVDDEANEPTDEPHVLDYYDDIRPIVLDLASLLSITSPSDMKVHIAQTIAGAIRAAGNAPAAHTITEWFVSAFHAIVKRHNMPFISKEDKEKRWRFEHEPMIPYAAAIMCAAEHSLPDNGLLLMEIAADKPTGSDSEDRVGNGILRWFDPDRHKWVRAEMPDGKHVSGPIRDMFYAYCPGGNEREFDIFRVNLRRFVPEYDVGAKLRSGEIDPRWSLVNGGSMAWHRATYELKPLVGDPKELGYKGTVIGAYMADDGTGHAVRVEPPEFDVVTASGEHKRWNAARDFIQPMFPDQEEAGVDAMRQVFAYWVCRSFSNREVPFLYGPAKGGKSCIIRLTQNLCGGNFASLSLGDFANNKAKASILGKVGIIGEDNAPDERMVGDGVKSFKNVADQGVFDCDPLYSERTQMRFTGSIVQAGNSLTRTNDRTGAVASRIVPTEIKHSFEGDPDRVSDVIEKIVYTNDMLVWAAQWGADGCEDGVFKEFDISNPIFAAAKQEFMDASDWVRVFMKKHVEELDAAGVDCEIVPALYDAFRAYYAKNVSGHGATVAFDRDFRTSLVKVADELGFVITLDEKDQLKVAKPRRGFYESELLHGIYRNFTEPVRTDFPSGRTVWRNHDLMRWVTPAELYDNPATGEKGLLSGTIRGVMYRKSALERFEQEGITPAQAHAQRRAEKHRAAWENASKDDRNRYRNYIERLFTFDDAKKVGPDFLDFGVGDDGAARATVYVHRDTGFAYVAPTMDEWIAQRRPHNVVPYNKAEDHSNFTVLEVGFAHDPGEAWYVVTDESNIYVEKYAWLDDDVAPTSVSASSDASTSNETPAQTLGQPSAPADGADEAPASTGEPAPANEPSAGSGAATPPDTQPAAPQKKPSARAQARKPARGPRPTESGGLTWAPWPPSPPAEPASDPDPTPSAP